MNKLVLALGSNQGDSIESLKLARLKLAEHFGKYEASRIYVSNAVDYVDQPQFFNQAVAFDLPKVSAEVVLEKTMSIEAELGRTRLIKYGPRTIDIDLIFYADQNYQLDHLKIPHPRFLQRSFVVHPLLDLSIKSWLLDNYAIPDHFEVIASPID